MVMSSPNVGQRVFNIFHQLDDQTLPYDLWSDDAELAAMVYLLKQHPKEEAVTKYSRAVSNYNESNTRIGIPVIPFHATSAWQKMTAVSSFIDSLPRETSAAAIYRKLLSADVTGHNGTEEN